MALIVLLCKKRTYAFLILYSIFASFYIAIWGIFTSRFVGKKRKRISSLLFRSCDANMHHDYHTTRKRDNCRQRENKTAPFTPFLSSPFHLGGWCRLPHIALYRDTKSPESTSRASKCNWFPFRSVHLLIKNFEKRQSGKMKWYSRWWRTWF